MLKVEHDFRALFADLDGMTQAAEEGARPAAQAGAQVFYDEVRARVPVSAKIHATKGKKQVYKPGNLRAAVYQAFNDDDSGNGRAAYSISWNKTKAFYGRFLENGTSRMAAKPFLRPSYEAKKQAAAQAARDELLARIKARRE